MAVTFELNLPADAFITLAANTPNRAVVQNRTVLAFDDSAIEGVRSQPFAMPAAYTGAGTLKADVFYIMASATSGTVAWSVAVQAVTPADATDLDAGDTFDTNNDGTGTVPSTAGYLGKITISLTNKNSVATLDYVRLKLERKATDGTNDTATGDARFLFIRLYEE